MPMKFIFSCFVFLLCSLVGRAQGENRIWAYGQGSGLDFTGAAVAYKPSSVENYHHYSGAGAASICDKEGNLLFYTNGAKVWGKDGAIMSGGILLSGYPMGPIATTNGIWLLQQTAAIAQDPSDRNQYYIFHTWRNSLSDASGFSFSDTCSLFYSVVNMKLNNGRGGVVASRKKILIDQYTTGALTVALGTDCNVWVLTHSIGGNTFKAYELTVSGLNTTPVLSNTGLPVPPPYYYDNNIYLFSPTRTAIKVSPNGKKLAHSRNQGADAYGNSGPSSLELFDFNAATGQVQNPVPLVNVGENVLAVNDVCFSNGSSKLYYALTYPCIGCGAVAQFDISLATPAAIVASNTYISTVPVSYSIKNAPDGRVYIAKGYGSAGPYAPASEGLFYIQQPELAGTACQFVGNNLLFPSFDSRAGIFPNDIAVLKRDTVTSTKEVLVCGRDTLWLQPDTPITNCLWWDNTSLPRKAITQPGTYTVQYQKGCTDRFDTFVVRFQKLPLIAWDSASCHDPALGKAYAIPQDSTAIAYTWKREEDILSSRQSTIGDTISNLSPGNYSVRLATVSGCDTMVQFAIAPYPETLLAVSPAQTRIRYGDSIQLQASGARFYAWWPSGTVSNDTIPDPYVHPLKPTVYTVLGLNEYGCRDTATVSVDIDFEMPVFIPNAFSPNGDGINDVFKLEHISYQKLAAFRIFNRWGEQLFETSDPLKGWDGRHKGMPCNTDTYYYLVVINYPDGATRTFKGDLTLIR